MVKRLLMVLVLLGTGYTAPVIAQSSSRTPVPTAPLTLKTGSIVNRQPIIANSTRKRTYRAPSPAITSSTNANDTVFRDVPPGCRAAKAIDNLANYGVLKGFADGSYRPDQPITRAQFVSMLVHWLPSKLEIESSGPARPVLTDVPPGYWAARDIYKAYDLRWISGEPSGSFGPGEPLTRGQLADILVYALHLVDDGQRFAFSDCPPERWDYRDLNLAWQAGFLHAIAPNLINPDGLVTRAQAAEVLDGYDPRIDQSSLNATVTPLGDGDINDANGDYGRVMWSPSGDHFCYYNRFDLAFKLGNVNTATVQPLSFPDQRHVVALTDNAVIVASSDDDQDWIYPLTTTGLGEPKALTLNTDLWQEWVNTQQGPGVLVGGYKPGSLAVELRDKTQIPLGGGNAFLSVDRKLGAVVSTPRPTRLVHPIGDVAVLLENQPDDPTQPITIWNFAAPGKPTKLFSIQLPKIDTPTAETSPSIQFISFSPNDKYLAILVGMNDDNGKLSGQTFIYDTSTGRLLGEAPYGNGIQWLADQSGLWLNTDQPAGSGLDKVVDLHGQLVNTWKDAYGRPAWALNRDTFILTNRDGELGWSHWDYSFSGWFPILPIGQAYTVCPSPNGSSGLLFFETQTPGTNPVALVEIAPSP